MICDKRLGHISVEAYLAHVDALLEETRLELLRERQANARLREALARRQGRQPGRMLAGSRRSWRKG